MRSSPFDEPDHDQVTPEGMIEIRTLEQALALLDSWVTAYDELRREYARLHARYSAVLFSAAMHKTGEESNWTLYKAALTADDGLRAELLAQIERSDSVSLSK